MGQQIQPNSPERTQSVPPPAQGPLNDSLHRVQKWVITFFTPGSAQDAALLRFGKMCSQRVREKQECCLHQNCYMCVKRVLNWSLIALKWLCLPVTFWTCAARKMAGGGKGEIAYCAVVCFLRAVMEAPSRSLVLSTNRTKPRARRASLIFDCSRIGPHCGCIATIWSLAFI